MTDDTINSTNSQKMSVYCKTCVCKGCHAGQEYYNQGMWHGMAIGSKEELDRLKEENERLKEELSGKRFICKDCMAFAKRIEQYKQTLQEIKAIAEENRDTSQYGGICKSILALITKAEKE